MEPDWVDVFPLEKGDIPARYVIVYQRVPGVIFFKMARNFRKTWSPIESIQAYPPQIEHRYPNDAIFERRCIFQTIIFGIYLKVLGCILQVNYSDMWGSTFLGGSGISALSGSYWPWEVLGYFFCGSYTLSKVTTTSRLFPRFVPKRETGIKGKGLFCKLFSQFDFFELPETIKGWKSFFFQLKIYLQIHCRIFHCYGEDYYAE